MKYIIMVGVAFVVAVLVTLIALFVLAYSGAYAYDPPNQSTDNATDVILWFGDSANVTISGSASISIPELQGLQADMKAAADELAAQLAAQIAAILKIIIEGVIVLAINYFAYQYRDRWMFIAGGFALILYGFPLWHDYRYLSVLLVITGIYTFSKAWWDTKAWNR